jgi:hypothetical protein
MHAARRRRCHRKTRRLPFSDTHGALSYAAAIAAPMPFRPSFHAAAAAIASSSPFPPPRVAAAAIIH